MESRIALEHLESLRPHTADADDPTFSNALKTVADDPRLSAELSRRQAWDKSLGRAMQDVSVPPALAEKLLVRLQKTEAATVVTPAESVRPEAVSRRRWMPWAASVMSVALLLTAGVGWWLFNTVAPLSLDAVIASAPYTPDAVNALPVFDESFAAPLPQGGWLDDRRIRFPETVQGGRVTKGAEAAGAGQGHQFAVREFQFYDPQRPRDGVIRGVLLILPAEHLASLPAGSAFVGSVYTTTQSKPRIAVHTWSEGDRVFVSFVAIEHVQGLERALAVDAV